MIKINIKEDQEVSSEGDLLNGTYSKTIRVLGIKVMDRVLVANNTIESISKPKSKIPGFGKK